MIEKLYDYWKVEEKKIEILVETDDVQINHVLLPKGDRLPEHFSNAPVNLIIIRGTMSAQLGDQEPHMYGKGKIMSVPYNTKMNILNGADDMLEFFIVKAPHPKSIKK